MYWIFWEHFPHLLSFERLQYILNPTPGKTTRGAPKRLKISQHHYSTWANDHTSPIWKTHGKTLKGNAGSPISNILWSLRLYRLSPEKTSWQLWMTLKFHTLGSIKTKTVKKIIKVIRFMSQCKPATELTTWHSQLKIFACKSLLDRNPFFGPPGKPYTPNTQLVPAAVFEATVTMQSSSRLCGKTRDAQPFSQQKQQSFHWDVLSPKCFCWIQMARFFADLFWTRPHLASDLFSHLELWRHRQISSAKALKKRLTKKTSWSLAYPAMTPCFSCAWSNHPLISLAGP